MLNLNHKKLEVWKKSILLLVEIKNLLKQFPKEENFNLISQMRRAALSISNNLAEGYVTIEELTQVERINEEIFKMISGLIKANKNL